MSTEQHGHHDEGGHELEAINTKLLFRLLISLSIVTLLASMAVVQWYYSQRSELERRHAAEGSFLLAQYKERMAADIDGIELVRKQILADGKVLNAPAPPAGWVHPDDLLSGGAAAAAPAMPAEPKPVEPKPAEAPIAVEGQPGIPVPAGEAKPEGETKPEGEAKPEAAKPEKPEAEKPAKPEKPANEGKGDEKKADEAKQEG